MQSCICSSFFIIIIVIRIQFISSIRTMISVWAGKKAAVNTYKSEVIRIKIYFIKHIKASANNLNNDINFKHLIEHALSCTLERVDKDVLYMGGLRFGTIDESCLIKATWKEANCEWLERAVPSSTGRAVLAHLSRMSKTSQ